MNKRLLKFAHRSRNLGRLRAMIDLARSEEPIADAGDSWDTDRYLLAVANGVVDLQTGQLRAGLREDKITRSTNIEFDPDAKAPRWEKFLAEIFSEDHELVNYVRRAVGYSATGDTREHCLFFMLGSGANGKSTFLNVVRQILGDYGHVMPSSTIASINRSNVPNDVAALDGARFIVSSETSERAKLNEERIKALTGGDKISARFLYREFFEFTPCGKFWIATNHMPRVEDDSAGFWRRVRVIPFFAMFSGEQLDRDLERKLLAERPGILNWIVRGALEWQKAGLQAPKAVEEATNEFREESDTLRAFVSECCIEEPKKMCRAGEIFREYQEWTKVAGIEVLDRLNGAMFGRRMSQRFRKCHDAQGAYYLEVGIKNPAPF